jgi:hypothetical protein
MSWEKTNYNRNGAPSDLMYHLQQQYNRKCNTDPFVREGLKNSSFGIEYSRKYPHLSIFEIVCDSKYASLNPNLTLAEVYLHQHPTKRTESSFWQREPVAMPVFESPILNDVEEEVRNMKLPVAVPYDNLIDKRLMALCSNNNSTNMYEVD